MERLKKRFSILSAIVDALIESPETVAYPYGPLDLPQGYRGAIVIDPDKCTLCGDCVRACAFHALAKVGGQILLFPQLCHGCGNCSLICPEKAITEKPRAIGQIRQGKSKHGITYLMGELTISEPMPTPVIHQLKALSDPALVVTILDSPPGASCAVVETLHDADFVILVTEPTPFGLHDLKQMLGILEQTAIPSGVIINRVGIGNDDVRCFAQQKGLDILMEIPYQQHIAAELARGRLFSEISPAHIEKFQALYEHLLKLLERKVLS